MINKLALLLLTIFPLVFSPQSPSADRCYIATWNEEIMVVRWDNAPVLDVYEAVALLKKTAPDTWQEWFPVWYRYRDDKGVVFYTFYNFDGGAWEVPLGFCRGWLDGDEVLRRYFTETYDRDFAEKLWIPIIMR